MPLGTQLKLARNSKKLTQRQLGELVGVTGSAIGNYENGVSSPNEETLIALMSVLCIDANFLYADEMTKLDNIQFLSPEEERLITIYRSLNPSGQATLLTTAESFPTNPSLTEEKYAASES